MANRRSTDIENLGAALANVPAFNLNKQEAHKATSNVPETSPIIKVLLDELASGKFATYQAFMDRLEELASE